MKGRQKIDDFLGNCEERWFGFEEIVEEVTNNLIEHVGGKTIKVEQFPDDFELGMKVFIAGAEVKKNPMKQATN